MAVDLKAVGMLAAGGAVGAMAGGPLGLVGGVAVGALVDFAISKFAKHPAAPGSYTAPVAPSPGAGPVAPTPMAGPILPPTADHQAATNAIKLLAIGKPAEAGPAKVWLTQFQSSVGLPATGAMDPQTRVMLLLADPVNGPRLPATTLLG